MNDPNYIDHREREIRAFEARARGEVLSRTPRQLADRIASRQPNGAATMNTHVTEHREAIPLPATPPLSLLDIILHAGSDPRFDVEKFRALVQIQREEQDRQDARAERDAVLEAEAAFDVALSEVQGKIAPICANQYNSQTRSRYADYAALDRVIKPIYAPAGFSLSFDEEDSPKPDHIRVVCLVTYVAPGAKRSHKRRYHTDMPADGKGAKGGDVMTKTHATSSAFTYGQRRVASNIFNIAIAKDDDGNAAGTKNAEAIAEPMPGAISGAQAGEIRKALTERGLSETSFLRFIQLPSIEHIGVEHFDRALAKIKRTGARS